MAIKDERLVYIFATHSLIGWSGVVHAFQNAKRLINRDLRPNLLNASSKKQSLRFLCTRYFKSNWILLRPPLVNRSAWGPVIVVGHDLVPLQGNLEGPLHGNGDLMIHPALDDAPVSLYFFPLQRWTIHLDCNILSVGLVVTLIHLLYRKLIVVSLIFIFILVRWWGRWFTCWVIWRLAERYFLISSDPSPHPSGLAMILIEWIPSRNLLQKWSFAPSHVTTYITINKVFIESIPPLVQALNGNVFYIDKSFQRRIDFHLQVKVVH